jgi:membrane-associated phospholipid phosphatase
VTLALLIAVSRTQDYRHNFDDIAVGSFIGILSGGPCFPSGTLITSRKVFTLKI